MLAFQGEEGLYSVPPCPARVQDGQRDCNWRVFPQGEGAEDEKVTRETRKTGILTNFEFYQNSDKAKNSFLTIAKKFLNKHS